MNETIVKTNTIRGIIFDLDDTLYDYQSLHIEAINTVKEMIIPGWHISEEEFKKLYSDANLAIKEKFEHVAISHHKLLYFKHMAENVEKAGFYDPYDMYNTYWNYIYDNMKPSPGAIELLKLCKKYSIKIAICTDQLAHIQYNKLKHLGIDPYIDYMITSEEIGIEKPSKLMFCAVLDKLRLSKNEVLMIGDDYEKDYLGAKKIGIKSLLYDTKGRYISLDSEDIIYQLLDLRELIK